MGGISRPLIIVGAPRSGTSMLGWTLKSHPEVWYANEPSPVWRYGNETRSDLLRPEQLTDAIRNHIVGSFRSDMDKNGKAYLVEKTPQNCLRLPFVDTVFPDARYVMIHRDPVETCLSIADLSLRNTSGLSGVRVGTRLREIPPTQWLRYGIKFAKRFLPNDPRSPKTVWGPKLPGINAMYRELALVEVTALQWRYCVELAVHFLDAIQPERVMEVRLCDISDDVVEQVVKFAGWPRRQEVLDEFARRYDSSRVEHRSKHVDEEVKAQIEMWIHPTRLMLEKRETRSRPVA